MASLLTRIFGSANERTLRRLWPIVEEVNALEAAFQALPAEAFPERTAEFRRRLAAEEGWLEGPVPRGVVETYLASFGKSGIDTLVLGCTHYPLLRPVIAAVMGTEVTLVDSAEETARAVAALLEEQGLGRRQGAGQTSFFVTDVPYRFIRVGQRFLGARVESAVRVER